MSSEALGDTVNDTASMGIKFEIVLEARIELATPAAADTLCGVATLTPRDMVTSKLLANADRWADESVFSRDLIDRAVQKLLTRDGRLERCTQMMKMTLPPAPLRQRIKALMPKAVRLKSQ